MKHKAMRSALLGSAAVVLNFGPTAVFAQDDGQASSGGLDEVVVTAQRRSESVQKTSITLEVVSDEDIARKGLNNPEDLTRLTPGLSVTTSTPAPQIYVRGVGDFAATVLNNPAIGLNLDGVYIPRAEELSVSFFDLERIEVLKGPQGTLYGRNASGGAINLITRSPDPSGVAANASVEFGNLSAAIFEGGLNLPVTDNLAVRVSGKIARRDGYTTADRGDLETEAARIRTLWEPSDRLTFRLDGAFGHIGGRGSASVVINGPAGMDPYEDNTSAIGQAYMQSGVYAGPVPDLRPLVVSPDSDDAFVDMDFRRVSATMEADLGFALLTVIPAYAYSEIAYNTYPFLQVSFGTAFGTFPASPNESEATTVEARLSNETDRLKWVLGGYYYNESQSSQFHVNAGPLQNTGRVSNVDTKAYAAFGQATYSLTDRFRVVGGLRYTSDQRVLTDGATFYKNPSFLGLRPANPMMPPGPMNPLVPVFFNPPDPSALLLIETYSGDKTFENVSWKAGLEYDAGDNVFLYATASSGFKAGGFNQSRPLGAPPGSNDASFFRPEKLTAYDIGLKSTLMDNRLQLNLGAFYWDYKDQHVRRFAIGSAGNLDLVFENAQSARMFGGNIDVVAKPWDAGTLSFSVEYNNAKYKTYVFETAQLLPGSTGCPAMPAMPIVIGPAGPVQSVDCSGRRMPRAPMWAGSVGYVHDFELGNGGTLSLAPDMSFVTEREITSDYVPASRVGGYVLVNASLTYRDPSDRYSVMAFVRNATQEEVYNGGSQPNYAPGIMAGSIGLPRTYGVRLSIDY